MIRRPLAALAAAAVFPSPPAVSTSRCVPGCTPARPRSRELGMDKCIKGGTVTLVPANGKLFWFWTGEKSEDPSVVLTRTGD